MEISHKYTHNLICPYCGHEDKDSWEVSPDSGNMNCESCEKEFEYEREIIAEYSTYKKSCEKEKHDYKTDRYHIQKNKYDNHKFVEIPESEWHYHRMLICSICNVEKHEEISKETYDHETMTPIEDYRRTMEQIRKKWNEEENKSEFKKTANFNKELYEDEK